MRRMPIQADYTGLEGKTVQNDSKMEIYSQRGYHSRYIRQLCPVCLNYHQGSTSTLHRSYASPDIQAEVLMNAIREAAKKDLIRSA